MSSVLGQPVKLDFDPDQPLVGDIEVLENAIVVPAAPGDARGIARNGGVLKSDGSWSAMGTAWRSSAHPVLCPTDQPLEEEIENISGTYLYGGMLYGHFGHFLCESTARLWALDHVDMAIDGIIFIPKRIPGWPAKKIRHHAKFFAALGLDTVNMHASSTPVRVERLIVPPQGFGTRDMIEGAPEYRQYMKENLGADIAADGPKKLYISRSELFSKRGSILGEKTLEKHLIAQGYTVFHPQQHDIDVQIAHYKAASVIVSLDGSALHLAAYLAQPDQKIAVLNRRPSDIITDFSAQYLKFANIEPLLINAVSRFWYREGSRRQKNEMYSLVDFPTIQAQLIDGGFIEASDKWAALEGDALADSIRNVEVRLGLPLIEVV